MESHGISKVQKSTNPVFEQNPDCFVVCVLSNGRPWPSAEGFFVCLWEKFAFLRMEMLKTKENINIEK